MVIHSIFEYAGINPTGVFEVISGIILSNYEELMPEEMEKIMNAIIETGKEKEKDFETFIGKLGEFRLRKMLVENFSISGKFGMGERNEDFSVDSLDEQGILFMKLYSELEG